MNTASLFSAPAPVAGLIALLTPEPLALGFGPGFLRGVAGEFGVVRVILLG
jgi:hypothetical protein